MAGITGRAYNISGTGLNHIFLDWLKQVAVKRLLTSGIDKLMNAVKMQVPTSTDFAVPVSSIQESIN